MASKWAWLKDDPRFRALSDDTSYDEALLASIRNHEGRPLEALAEALNAYEAHKACLEQQLSAVNLDITGAQRVMEREFDARGVDSIAVGGYRFSPKPEPAPKVVDPEVWLDYARQVYPELFSVNAQTMKATVSRLLEAGEEIPPGIEINVRTSISRRKS